MSQRYEVQTRMWAGWENCWTNEDVDGYLEPTTFASAEEAQAGLTTFLSDVKEAAVRCDISESYDPADYRIVPNVQEKA